MRIGQEPKTTNKWLALAGLGMGVLMSTLDASIVNISLPTLVETFQTDFATIQWVVLSYSLVLTSFMLAIARLGDMLDKKKIYQAGMVIFTIGSLLCGLSPAVEWLIAFRALQGLGAVMIQALGMAMVTEVFPPHERGRALGIIGSVVSIGIAMGPPIGGLLIGSVGWHWVFLVNIPVGLAALAIVRRFVPSSPPTQTHQQFDPFGAGILFITLMSYALGMTIGQNAGFSSPLPMSLLLVVPIGIAALIFVERRVQQPLLDFSLFRKPLFSLNLLMSLLVFIVLAATFILPFYLELVKGFGVGLVGFMMMANPVTMGLIAPISGILSDRFGPRGISLAGLIVLAAALLGMSTLTAETTILGIILRLIPMGLAFGLFQSPNNSAIMGSAPRQRLGIASGLMSLSRTLGTTSGLPLMGAIFTMQVLLAGSLPVGSDITAASSAALVAGLSGTFRTAAAIILIAAGLAGFLVWLDRREKNQPVEWREEPAYPIEVVQKAEDD